MFPQEKQHTKYSFSKILISPNMVKLKPCHRTHSSLAVQPKLEIAFIW